MEFARELCVEEARGVEIVCVHLRVNVDTHEV
jgi:hypothetical protein